MGTFESAARRGYRGVWELIKDYAYGWWLQVSRTFIFAAWIFIAGAFFGLGSFAAPSVGVLTGLISFFMLPVAAGYIEERGEEPEHSSGESMTHGEHQNPYASEDEDYAGGDK